MLSCRSHPLSAYFTGKEYYGCIFVGDWYLANIVLFFCEKCDVITRFCWQRIFLPFSGHHQLLSGYESCNCICIFLIRLVLKVTPLSNF
ncbi:hypothetical protein Ancab_023953 [Ancistrocladus abbreviatus]